MTLNANWTGVALADGNEEGRTAGNSSRLWRRRHVA
jgi:hypothetical protein